MSVVLHKRPCAKCPFRRDVAIYLRLDHRREIVHSLTVEDQDFHCHQTVDYSDETPHGGTTCAGAQAMLIKSGHGPSQVARIVERLGMANYDDTADHADVWTIEEFTSLAEGSVEGAEVVDEDGEVETCSMVGPNCIAPAGYATSGGVVRGSVAADSACGECGDPVCSECLDDDGLCENCAEWQEESA